MSEHFHHTEISTLRERNFFDPPAGCRQPASGGAKERNFHSPNFDIPLERSNGSLGGAKKAETKSLEFVTEGTERRVSIGLEAGSGEPESIESHLGRMSINGEALGLEGGMLLAKCMAILGQRGVEGLVQHLATHEQGVRLATE